MFVRIGNTPRDYAWGSTTAISELLGTPASGKPEAELWLGAHPGSPSRVLSPEQTGGAQDLAAWIAEDPAAALGEARGELPGARLPFLLKVLAAAGPLSLQAHPSPGRAAAGFAAENAAGVPLDSPARNYKDPFHKPELIYALSDRFEALCGFREVAQSVAIVDQLIEAGGGGGEGDTEVGADGAGALAAFRARLAVGAASVDASQRGLRETVGWLLGGGVDVAPLVDAVVAASARLVSTGGDVPHDRELRTVAALAESYPGDPGIVLSLLLNRVSLRRGEALYLPAGNIHAYLEGLGIELMAASDNVLRGGLTPKHIDVPELLAVLEFTPLPVPYLVALHVAPGVDEFRPDVPDFALWHIEVGADAGGDAPTDVEAEAGETAIVGASGFALAEVVAGSPDLLVVPLESVLPDSPSATVPLGGPAIALCIDGAVELGGAKAAVALRRGESVYVTPEEASVTVSGSGTVFFATPNE